MSKTNCILYPEAPNGESSRVYKKLLKKLKNRLLVNYLYAVYRTNDTADHMDNDGYQRNTQGEHEAEDILKYLNYDQMQRELADNLSTVELSLGAIDMSGNRVDFTDAEEALKKANDFNEHHSAYSAIVVQHGDIYNIIVSEKNSRTHTYGDTVKEYLQSWDIYKQVFNGIGVDITNMPTELQGVFNTLNTGLAQYLKNLQGLSPDNLYKKDALTLFSLNPNSQHTQNIINEFGSIEDAAQALDDFNHSLISLTDPQKRLLLRAVRDAQNFQGIDMNDLIQQIKKNVKNLYAFSPEQEVKAELRMLNKKYGIDKEEIHRTVESIRTLSDAAADAAITLQRQIRELEKIKGNNAEGRRLEDALNNLMKELSSKKYYSGVLKFLGEASSQISEIDNMLQNIPQTGTEMEKSFGTAKILQDIKTLKDQYYTLVSALASENLVIDESISQADIDNIRQSAQQLKDFFDKKSHLLDDLAESTMTNLLINIMGNNTPDGQSIINAVRMAATDSKVWDWLYSIGRANNPIIGAMGSIVRNAQDSRDKKMNDIALRVRRANDKLRKAGYTSEFMYEDERHIASDIDWSMYETARRAKMKSLRVQKFQGFDFKQALENWENQNTEDRIVDFESGRTERVPNATYRKAIDFKRDWSPEQIEYYDTMMQLKGEIGTMLPTYAQHQYFPPQLRRDFLDALHDSNNLKDVGRAFKNKLQNFYKVRENDQDYKENGIIDGDEYQLTASAYDNTPLRQIPIFFVNKVEDGELLKDFSTGITALAGTAINYAAMDNIADVVEFIGNFAKEQKAREETSQADLVQNGVIKVFKDVYKRATNTNTQAIVDGFIAQHIYGQRLDTNMPQWFTKAFSNIIAYTSFKGLATNIKGAFANYLMGEFQMMIEAGAGEFYGGKDYIWAHSKLFGNAGAMGDIMELGTNNIKHKSVLMRELFDPLQENFEQKSHTRYYNSLFRQMISHDCSFIGYASGEYLIHYVNMYAILHKEKVMLDGKKISMYNAFELTNNQDGNTELRLKKGVTDLDGNPITQDYIDKVRRKIRYANQTTHGAMNAEDKGIIYQKWWGRGLLNFRQWMIEHLSRRFRGAHFDATLGTTREGYWYTFFHEAIKNEDTQDAWDKDQKLKAIGLFMKDLYTFTLRSEAQWDNLNEMQKHNIKRVRSEMLMYFCLLGLSFALGAPEDHKKEFWRRWWIYQTKRALMDTETSMPHPKAISNALTIINSPMASLNTMNSLLYAFYGITNGDIFTEIKSGDYKGWNKYFRNMVKYNLPFFKDWEQMQQLSEDDSVFKVFEDTPSNR